ncbi:MAG: hypothetical protein HYZ28_20710 [Myxococcales bacterium]|nr:hypothetical protein [Myxococcales bacterium]
MHEPSNEGNAERTERRKGKPSAPLFGELLIESNWRPADRPPVSSEGWLRAHGYAPERRKGA